MRAVALFAVAALAGCAAYEKQQSTRFEPVGTSEFRFEAEAGVDRAEGSAEAEAIRRGFIADYVRDNRVCPGGYDIIERKPVIVRQALLGPVHRIYYRGRCKN